MVWPLSKKSRKSHDLFEVFPEKRVCKYCKKFSCGRALGGHMRTHSKKTRLCRPRKCHTRSSSFPLCSNSNNHCTKKVGSEIDMSTFLLSGWKVHKKRGLREGKRDKSHSKTEDKEAEAHDDEGKEIEAVEVNDDQEEETDYAQDSDDDDMDFSMIESLKEYKLSGFTHEISRSTDRNRYVCLTCNIVFPTFHAVRCHVHGSDSSSANAEEEEGLGAESVTEVDEADDK